jgi:hypothetical protein
MPRFDREECRRIAMECVDFARTTTDADLRELLVRAQEWLKLAYASTEAEFARLLDQFNQDQIGFREPPAVQRQPMQQQQQQQKKMDEQ